MTDMQAKWKGLEHTFLACCLSNGYAEKYTRGEYAPHYPVPSTIGTCYIGVGYKEVLIHHADNRRGGFVVCWSPD